MGISSESNMDGIDASVELVPTDKYNYVIGHLDRTGTGSEPGPFWTSENLSLHPHWRKFKIHGLQLNNGDKILIKSLKDQTTGTQYSPSNVPTESFVTPEVDDNGNVFFYIYCRWVRNFSNQIYYDVVNVDNYPFSEENGLRVRSVYTTSQGQTGWGLDTFEIYYPAGDSYVFSGIVFTIPSYH